MENKITEVPVPQDIMTVILGNSTPNERKPFKCVRCGKTVFFYYSEIRIIIEGEMREVSRPVDIMCTQQGCKTVYRVI
jgi:isocitrate dehydrogenase kinase/phosphatase